MSSQPSQFDPHQSRRLPPRQMQNAQHPTLRANPFPKVTDLFCRLPLSTFFYRLEAAHLGDLMRLSVRPNEKIIHSLAFSRVVESAPDTAKTRCCPATLAISPDNPLPWPIKIIALTRKENSCQDFRQRLRVRLRCRSVSVVWCRNITRLPFR